jgi:hypothetical protein
MTARTNGNSLLGSLSTLFTSSGSRFVSLKVAGA